VGGLQALSSAVLLLHSLHGSSAVGQAAAAQMQQEKGTSDTNGM
jgi:hypothetical protein